MVHFYNGGLSAVLFILTINTKWKKVLFIQLITKHQKEYGIKNKIIRKNVHKTTHNKYYVDDFIAMKIWIALGVEPEKVLKVKQEFEERNRMANEPF